MRDFAIFPAMAKYRSQKSLEFNGIDDWMVVYNIFGADTFIIRSYQVSTVNIWVKSTKSSGVTRQTIIGRWFPTVGGGLEVNEGGWRIYIHDKPVTADPAVSRALNFQVCTYWLNGLWITSQEPFPLDEHVMITLTYSGNSDVSGLKMYWNGVEKATYTIFNNWTTTGMNSNAYSHLLWGTQYTAWPLGQGGGSVWPPVLSFWFEGLMDETTLERFELSASEVLQLYHCGKPQSPMHVGLPNNKYVQTHFRMGEWTDGTDFLGLLKICWARYPVLGYNRNAFWNNPLVQRISEDVPS